MFINLFLCGFMIRKSDLDTFKENLLANSLSEIFVNPDFTVCSRVCRFLLQKRRVVSSVKR